jgi:hypothetical protein
MGETANPRMKKALRKKPLQPRTCSNAIRRFIVALAIDVLEAKRSH